MERHCKSSALPKPSACLRGRGWRRLPTFLGSSPTPSGLRAKNFVSRRLVQSPPSGAGPCPLRLVLAQSSGTAQGVTLPASWSQRPKLPPNGRAVGVDLGLASLAVTRDGEKIAPPKFLPSALKKLRRLQRALSRTHKTSRNRARARFLVAKCHAKVADKRLDFLHKLSTRLIRENQAVGIEDLNVAGLLKNHKLARSIADAGWRMFRILLESKAKMYGRVVEVFNRWHPSSQICSKCGHQSGKKTLSIRHWQCPNCEAVHDRDINAARNLIPEVAAGLAETQNACLSRSKSSLLVSGVDAGTHLNQEAQRCTT